jgi:hypothetical protein
MTNRNKGKKRTPSGGYRTPPPARQEAQPRKRPGLLDSFFAPRVPGSTSMPTIRTSITRGVVTVASTPAIVAYAIAAPLVSFLILISLGFEGPMGLMSGTFATAPVGTATAAITSGYTFTGKASLYAIFVVIAVQALLAAVAAAMCFEALLEGKIGAGFLRRVPRVFPVVFAVGLASFAALLTALILVRLLVGIGFAVVIFGLMAAQSWLGYAPAVALAENSAALSAIGTSVRAARVPGTSSLLLAALYFIGSVAFLLGATRSLGLVDVNPGVEAWAIILVANVLHVMFISTLIYRYLAIAPEVPPPAARRR